MVHNNFSSVCVCVCLHGALFGVLFQNFSSENLHFENGEDKQFLYKYMWLWLWMRMDCQFLCGQCDQKTKRIGCWCSIHSSVSNVSATQISQNDNKRHIWSEKKPVHLHSGEWNSLNMIPKFVAKQPDSFLSSFFDSIQLYRHSCICLSFRMLFFSLEMECQCECVLMFGPAVFCWCYWRSRAAHFIWQWHVCGICPGRCHWFRSQFARRAFVQWTIFPSTHTHVLEI